MKKIKIAAITSSNQSFLFQLPTIIHYSTIQINTNRINPRSKNQYNTSLWWIQRNLLNSQVPHKHGTDRSHSRFLCSFQIHQFSLTLTDRSNSFQHLNYTTIQRRNKASKQQNIEPTSVISIAYILFRFNIETWASGECGCLASRCSRRKPKKNLPSLIPTRRTFLLILWNNHPHINLNYTIIS